MDRREHSPTGQPDQLASPADRVRSLMSDLFAVLHRLAELTVETHRASRRADREVSIDELVELRERLCLELSHQPMADGVGLVMAPGVVAGHDRYLEWWRSQGTDTVPVRLNLDPTSVDGYDFVQMDWFTVPRDAHLPHVHGPWIDYSCSDNYVLTLAVPAVDGDQFLGVAGMDVRMAVLEPLLLAAVRSGPPDTVLVNAERRVLASASARWNVGTKIASLPAADPHSFGQWLAIGQDTGWQLGVAEPG